VRQLAGQILRDDYPGGDAASRPRRPGRAAARKAGEASERALLARGLGALGLGKESGSQQSRRRNQNGECPQILRAGDRPSGATRGRSGRGKRQGHPKDRDGALVDSPCSRCRALCVGDKRIPHTSGQRRCKSGQGTRVRPARRTGRPCPPSVADVVPPEVTIELGQREQASPHHQLCCAQDELYTLNQQCSRTTRRPAEVRAHRKLPVERTALPLSRVVLLRSSACSGRSRPCRPRPRPSRRG
jgi:hypothetical protein